MLEVIAIGFVLLMLLGLVAVFVGSLRYIAYKEKQVLRGYDLMSNEELDYE